MRALGLAWLLVHLPWGVQLLFRRVRESPSWAAGDAALTLGGLLLVLALAPVAGGAAGLPLAACGAALCAARTAAWLRGGSALAAGAALVAGALLGVSLAAQTWTDGIHDPLFD